MTTTKIDTFLSPIIENTYERSLSNLPYIGSSHQTAQIEVWVSDDSWVSRKLNDGCRHCRSWWTWISIFDVCKDNHYPIIQMMNLVFHCRKNGANNIYNKLSQYSNINNVDKINSILVSEFGMKQSTDFEVFRGRRLNPFGIYLSP